MKQNFEFRTATYRVLIPKAWLIRVFANTRSGVVTLTFSGCQMHVTSREHQSILRKIDGGLALMFWEAGAYRGKPPADSVVVERITIWTEDGDEDAVEDAAR